MEGGSDGPWTLSVPRGSFCDGKAGFPVRGSANPLWIILGIVV